MKYINNSSKIIFVFTFTILSLTNCGGKVSENQSSTEKPVVQESAEVTESSKETEQSEKDTSTYGSSIDLKTQQAILITYHEIKKNLVETNLEESKISGQKMLKQLENNWDEAKVNEDQAILNLRELLTVMGQKSDIEEVRAEFHVLTQFIYDMVKVNPEMVGENSLFLHHCPMAFDNKGAVWLSAEPLVRNPYFGHKMLKCGTIQEEIKI